jgi:hypothetical protein
MQSLHWYCALQAVEPNWLIIRVFFDLHRGQGTLVGSANKTLLSTSSWGGAIPYSSKFLRPFSEIQSVVHAGEIIVLIS